MWNELLRRSLPSLRPVRRSLEGPTRLRSGGCRSGATGALRLLSLNVRHGRGPGRIPGPLRRTDFRAHASRVGAYVRGTNAHVVALQELDAPSSWSGLLDHAEPLLEGPEPVELAHGIHFGLHLPWVRFAYGTALLSRLRLNEVCSLKFGTRPIDTKGLVVAEVELDGRPLDVASVHLDVLRGSRRRQAAEAVRRLRARGRPLVLLGDLNSTGRRADGAAEILARGLVLRPCPEHAAATYPSWRPRRRLDWVLASPELAIRAVPAPAGRVSDHVALAAEVRWTDGAP